MRRSFAAVAAASAFALSVHAAPAFAEEAQQSVPAEAAPAPAKEAQQSVPTEATPAPAKEAQQSVPAEATPAPAKDKQPVADGAEAAPGKEAEGEKEGEKPALKIGDNGYVQPENGFTRGEVVKTVEKFTNDKGCDNCTRTTETISNKVNLEGAAVFNMDLKDYSNNGFTKKVWNPNNHPNLNPEGDKNPEGAGPGNVEMQHYLLGKSIIAWRPVFATDYPMSTAEITIDLPDEGYVASDATSWFVDRYLPAVAGKQQPYKNKMVPSEVTVVGKKATVKFASPIDAYSGWAGVFTKDYGEKGFDKIKNANKEATMKVTGEWDVEKIKKMTEEAKKDGKTLYGNPIAFKDGSLEKVTETCDCPPEEDPGNPGHKPSNPSGSSDVPGWLIPIAAIPLIPALVGSSTGSSSPAPAAPVAEAPAAEAPVKGIEKGVAKQQAPAASEKRVLANTGADVAGLAGFGAALMAAGAFVVGRRRK